MEIEYLRQFIVLAKRLNFTAAADSLFITQSALSRHMASLEQELDIKLLRRNTQSVSLTPAGEMFRDRIDALLDDYDDICSRLRIMKSGFNNRLCIGVPYYAMKDYLRDVPEQFERTYTDIKLQYSVGDPHEVIKLFNRGKIDLAILPRYRVLDENSTCIIPLYKEPLGVLMSAEDPLAQKETVCLKDLQDKIFLSVDNIYFFNSWRHTASLCKAAGFTPKGPGMFNQMEALMMAIRRGDGITVVGKHMRAQESDFLAFRLLKDPGCERELCIIYKKDNDNTSIQKFAKLYLENMSVWSLPTSE
ncbi:MAG: LysR family transcriptional regulator [Oscillospiraceae bacterium]|nr:LysR family transcriptional regulator [Oscillospiraceae bacterium]